MTLTELQRLWVAYGTAHEGAWPIAIRLHPADVIAYVASVASHCQMALPEAIGARGFAESLTVPPGPLVSFNGTPITADDSVPAGQPVFE